MSPDSITANQVIADFQQAAEANRHTGPRSGSLIEVDGNAQDVVVGADLHGHRLHYQRILQLADLPNHPQRHLVLQEVCHGGPQYPRSRACMSHLMLEDVARLKLRFPDRVHFLLSNHELAEFLDQPIIKGNRMLNLQFRIGMERLYGAATDDVRSAACDFIRSCPLAVKLPNRIWISHSAPEQIPEQGFDMSVFSREPTQEDLSPGGPGFRLVWGRDFRQKNADAFAALVDCDVLIHGHEPCDNGYSTPNSRQLILDSSRSPGCCLQLDLETPGRLSAVVEGIHFI